MEQTISSVDRATSELRQMIFSGELPPGSDHLETELAERLGMSRTPIREAALTLRAQGLVELRPRRGLRIAPVRAQDMRDIYDILTELESLAAARAAEAAYSREDLATLAAAIKDMDKALAQDDLQAWAQAEVQGSGCASRRPISLGLMSISHHRPDGSAFVSSFACLPNAFALPSPFWF